jgi:hypothetical protein
LKQRGQQFLLQLRQLSMEKSGRKERPTKKSSPGQQTISRCHRTYISVENGAATEIKPPK